jgi:hypothetical protein
VKLRLPQGACEAQHYFSERDRSLLRTRKGRVARRVSGLNICLSDMTIFFFLQRNEFCKEFFIRLYIKLFHSIIFIHKIPNNMEAFRLINYLYIYLKLDLNLRKKLVKFYTFGTWLCMVLELGRFGQ